MPELHNAQEERVNEASGASIVMEEEEEVEKEGCEDNEVCQS